MENRQYWFDRAANREWLSWHYMYSKWGRNRANRLLLLRTCDKI